ncbi:MAG: class I SAM-dependent methyltransferase [Actinobacteria bacterium]|nr:class I SAM-dependent methyltransferase [Actinomycetota bacterium]
MLCVHDVEGWMSFDQAERLYRVAAGAPAGGTIVEIGSFRGRSTIVLGSAAPVDVAIIAIDPHAGNDRGPGEYNGFERAAATDHDVFKANIAAAGLTSRVRHVRAFSSDAHHEVPGDLSVLYIDGAHRYSPARTDIREWGRRVAPGGTMLIHDSFSSVGVTFAIMRELMLGRTFRFVGRSRSLAEYRADLRPTTGGRAANAFRQLLQLGWFSKNLLIKVLLSLKLGKVLHKATGRQPEWPY